MAQPTRSQRAAIERLLAKYEPELEKAFREAIELLVAAVDYNALIRALEAGNIEAAVDALNIRGAAFRPIDSAIATAFEAGGVATSAALPVIRNRAGVRVNVQFDIRNPKAERRLQSHITGLIQGLTRQAEVTAREVMADGLSKGINPRQTATRLLGAKDATGKRVGGIFGLNDMQTQWSINARAELEGGSARELKQYLSRTARDKRYDKMVQRAIDSGSGLTDDQVNKISRRYADNLLKVRAKTIAQTETLEALNSSKLASYEQLEDETGANASLSVKKWQATKDGRTRDQHREMDGVEVVGIDTPFTMPDGSLMLHPCDTSLGAGPSQTINCRCTFTVRLVYRDLAL